MKINPIKFDDIKKQTLIPTPPISKLSKTILMMLDSDSDSENSHSVLKLPLAILMILTSSESESKILNR